MKDTAPRGRISLAQLRQNVFIKERPGLTVARGARWLGHCLFGRRATISLWSGGPRLRLEPHIKAYGSTSLYMKRLEYEPQLEVLADLTRAGDVVLDIGANFGVYAVTLANRVMPGGSLHAFEPGEEALVQLRYNSEMLNPQLPISIWPMALSDESKAMTLHHVGGAPTTFSLAGTGHEESEKIEALTLDEWVGNQRLDRLDIIKIDVEGHEPRVFIGASSTLTKFRPTVMFEVSTEALRRAESAPHEPFQLLIGLGYDIYVLRQGRFEQIDHVEEGNLFAVHPQGPGWARLAAYKRLPR